MRIKLMTGLLVIVASLLAAAPIFAEQSYSFGSLFNGYKEIVVTGVVTKVEWTEPATAIYLNAKDAAGKPMTYIFASYSPSTFHQGGVRQHDFKVGEKVTITAAPAKDGTTYLGWLEMIKYPDKHVLVFRGGSE